MTLAGRLVPIAAAAWLGFVILQRLLSGRFWLWLIPDMVPPVIYLAAPVLLVVAGRFRRTTTILAAGSLLLGAGHGGLNVGAADQPPSAGAVRVFSWNTEYWHQDDDPGAFYRFLKDQRADVYVLQEYMGWVAGRPEPVDDLPRLRREFPGYHVAAEGELLTLSRFPITATRRVGPATALGPRPSWQEAFDLAKILRTDLLIGASTLSVYNVHIPVQAVLNVNPFAGLRSRSSHRDAQFRGLHADLDANPHAALVSGDFNSTGAMGEMRPLFDRMASANAADDSLYPTSWYAGVLPLWQLDWTFTDGLEIHAYDLRDPRGQSDHRAQSAVVSLVQAD
ncbi:endonuclease/exonuclease/phosphatase family protein [Herbidospora mongoliensis]|uniref:endonuclease/exonuclease/phosphatase family protein n=1 Tax=Herbidospora mongoliensis TaxID=688067 RepID=UPI0008340887|nr:endonuclease/exonuclease/phosphatase family protein [Herbidospora mongoliensis]